MHPAFANAMEYHLTRERGDGDIWDGAVMREWEMTVPIQVRQHVIHVSISCDAACFCTTTKQNIIPIVMTILNLPPITRKSLSGMFLAGAMPGNVKNFPLVFLSIMRRYLGNSLWDAPLHIRRGFPVRNGLHPHSAEETKYFKVNICFYIVITYVSYSDS